MVDTNTLKPLGREGAGPWLMDGGRLLRISSGNRPIRTEGEARAMLEAYRAAAAVAGTPQGHEVVAIDGGFGVVVDYVSGVGLGMHIAIGSYSPGEAGRAMGELLRGLHGARMDAGRDWNAVFHSWVANFAPLLPADAGDKLAALVASIPEDNRLLHGDFHVGNVVVAGGRLALIDMEGAGFGHPVFDLAVARSRTLGNAENEAERLGIDMQTAERVSHSIWKGLVKGYFEGADDGELERLDRCIEVLAEVERCCFAYDVAHTRPDDANERQRARIARCAERLAELLPRLDRLDF